MTVDGEAKSSSIKPRAHLHLKRVKMRKNLKGENEEVEKIKL